MNVKKGVKKLLIAKQEKNYNRLVESKKMDYNTWISREEEQLKIEKAGVWGKINCQTIEKNQTIFEGEKIKNDSELAEYQELCKLIRLFEICNEGNCKKNYFLCPDEKLEKVLKIVDLFDFTPEFVIIQKSQGELCDFAIQFLDEEFSKNKNQIVIYSDEDTINEAGIRLNPWFKPDWAPDDYLSYDYFGGFVAVRTELLKKYGISEGEDSYDFLKRAFREEKVFCKHTEKKLIGHIPYVLFHANSISSYNNVIEKHKKACNSFDESICNENGSEIDHNVQLKNEEIKVSVIIPSKDHPEVLERCLLSLAELTKLSDKRSIEIVVIDNGSNSFNKEAYNTLITRLNDVYDIKSAYYHEEFAFNFSKMCNMGVNKSTGNLLLFLNDDMEIVDPLWLDKMIDKAIIDYAGAVGAKLIYPPGCFESDDIIQHAGITNLRIGPAHKLQFMRDNEDIYFGRNRYCHDMMGVTGACLLLRRNVFEEVGGFDENLAVAFNDVDLCYKIYEAGYYNIERNDIKLLHHESLSRGNDAESYEKQQRLNREKDYLYEKHQSIYGKDPFYSINLTTDMLETEYAPKYHYEVDLSGKWAKPYEITDVIKNVREDKCLRIGMECAMDIYKWKYGVSRMKCPVKPTEDDLGFYFRGYSFVIGANNACYNKTLLLKNLSNGAVFGVDIDIEYRPDIKKNLADQLNVDLTGYSAKIRLDAVPQGEYLFGMYAKDKTSKQKLINWSNWTLDTASSRVGETYGL